MGAVEEERSSDTVYGVIIGVLYVVAVAVQVYVVVDEVTHGALSVDLKARWVRLSARWTQARRIDTEVNRLFPWVLWDAHEALEGGTP